MTTLRIGQVAKLLAVSTDTIRTWIDEGRIDPIEQTEGTELLKELT